MHCVGIHSLMNCSMRRACWNTPPSMRLWSSESLRHPGSMPHHCSGNSGPRSSASSGAAHGPVTTVDSNGRARPFVVLRGAPHALAPSGRGRRLLMLTKGSSGGDVGRWLGVWGRWISFWPSKPETRVRILVRPPTIAAPCLAWVHRIRCIRGAPAIAFRK